MQILADAILFDSDGVLVDSHAQVEVAWSQLIDEFGIESSELLTELIGVRAEDTLGRFLSGDRLAEALVRLEDLEVATASATEALAGAPELLADLPDGAWTIATSATERLAVARWSGAGIPVPAGIVTAEQVERGKPAPDPFLVAAANLGVDPTRCVVFEDSPAGGLAARASGAVVVAVGPHPWSFEPTVRVGDLRSVRVGAAGGGRLELSIDD